MVFLKAGDTKSAATSYVRYVLDARDALDVCTTKIRAIKTYLDAMQTEVAKK